MASSNESITLVGNSPPTQNTTSASSQPETMGRENFTLRSQLFLENPHTFLPFKQATMPPRAEEWIGNLGDALVPLMGDLERLGATQLNWGLKAMSRGSCPMLHTLYWDGQAQSVWDPMPEEMLTGYLEALSSIPWSFVDIVEEYLPGLFDPIRMGDSAEPTDPLASSRWYPKPMIVTACIFAERRILSDPRTTLMPDEDSNEVFDEDSNEDHDNDLDDNDEAYPRAWAGARLYNRYADQSDAMSDTSSVRSMSPGFDWNSDASLDITSSDSESDSDSAETCCWDDSDNESTASTCVDDSEPPPTMGKPSSESHLEHSNDGDIETAQPAAAALDVPNDFSDDSDAWDVDTIKLEFQDVQHELEDDELEMPAY